MMVDLACGLVIGEALPWFMLVDCMLLALIGLLPEPNYDLNRTERRKYWPALSQSL